MEKNIFKLNNNIYIVSNEVIEDNCYILSLDSIRPFYLDGISTTASMLLEGFWKKVVLTNDQKLIDSGIQKLDEDFLDWFAENPDCEYVEIFPRKKAIGWDYAKEVWNWEFERYQTIIPNNTVKSNTNPLNCENFKEVGCVKDVCSCSSLKKEQTVEQYTEALLAKYNHELQLNKIELLQEDLECIHLYLDDKLIPREEGSERYSIVGRIKKLEEYLSSEIPFTCGEIYEKSVKEESIENAAQRTILSNTDMFASYSVGKFAEEMFKLGVNWQKNRSYSEDDLKRAFEAGEAFMLGTHELFKQTHPNFEKWLNQNKKQ